MKDIFYPQIDATALKNIELARRLATEHPSYFLNSPYSGEVEKLLKSLINHKPIADVTNMVDGEAEFEGTRWEYLYSETSLLFRGLKTANAGSSVNDTGEQMAYFRTATSLMEKLISLQERALGLKEIHEFQKSVLDIMDGVLNDTQRTEVMEKLKLTIGVGN